MSIVLIARFKNERHILYEWVHHHLEEGVDKFILIDDQSNGLHLDNSGVELSEPLRYITYRVLHGWVVKREDLR